MEKESTDKGFRWVEPETESVEDMNEASKKVVLAYSGGLDTSVIAKWLMEQYELEVITFTADIGQERN